MDVPYNRHLQMTDSIKLERIASPSISNNVLYKVDAHGADAL